MELNLTALLAGLAGVLTVWWLPAGVATWEAQMRLLATVAAVVADVVGAGQTPAGG